LRGQEIYGKKVIDAKFVETNANSSQMGPTVNSNYVLELTVEDEDATGINKTRRIPIPLAENEGGYAQVWNLLNEFMKTIDYDLKDNYPDPEGANTKQPAQPAQSSTPAQPAQSSTPAQSNQNPFSVKFNPK